MKLDFAYHLRPDMTCSGVQGVFDLGEKRVLVDVPSPVVDAWTHLDISGEDLRIPADKECFFGYALLDCTEGYPHLFSVQEPVSGGVCLATFDGTIPDTPDWMVGDGWGFGPLMIAVTLEDGAVLTFDHIAPPPAGKYSVGDSLDLSLVPVSGDVGPETEISWFLDDEPVSGKPVLSKAGKHLLEARYVNTAGRRKVVEVEITVE